jgi:hypothetical protein
MAECQPQDFRRFAAWSIARCQVAQANDLITMLDINALRPKRHCGFHITTPLTSSGASWQGRLLLQH